MHDDDQNLDTALIGLDGAKRSTLKRLIGTGAFVGPMIVSFTMADLTIDAFMHAASANTTTTHAPVTTSGPSPTTTQPPRGHPAKS